MTIMKRALMAFYISSVGGGSAGAVLAARLSEKADVTVLLLEAGDDDRSNLLFQAPLLGQSVFHTDWVWEDFTEPHNSYLEGMKDRVSIHGYL